ncbi:MAG TPA: prephenate dehydrogenase/arogenate dehydrogenase family protein, partial [Elusimicrobiota bacterium]|nr:prephenate dehydrogenase/arogenate dehydrogenase family protein [Elusimicrobiota bacterium]
MTAGLIGFGRIGRLLAKHFARDAKIFVSDVKLDARAVRALGATPATLAQACAQDVVVLCVPMAAFEGVARSIKGLLKPGALVVDVCSVKEHPVRVMKRCLPKNVGLLATHPNFG